MNICTVQARNQYKMCENLVHVTSTISKLQHSKDLQPVFLDILLYSMAVWIMEVCILLHKNVLTRNQPHGSTSYIEAQKFLQYDYTS